MKARPAALAVPAFPPRLIEDLGETRLSIRADGRWREYRTQPLSAAVGAVLSRIWQQLDSWAPPPGSERGWTRPYRVGERSILEPGRRLPAERPARCVPDGWERDSDP